YWDLNDRTRAFTKRILTKSPKNYPNQAHASAYGITLHYLKAVQQMGDDDAFGPGRIRADGRGEFPAYLFQVKTKEESKGEWDLYKLIAKAPVEEVLHPLNDQCKFPT